MEHPVGTVLKMSESNVRVKISGTIPCQQYGNVVPEFEVEGPDFDSAVDLGLKQLQSVWNRVGREPLDINREEPKAETATGIVKKCRVSGTEVIFDPVTHVYRDAKGRKYTGGSTFAARYKTPFAAKTVAGKMATKHGVSQQSILDMWALNAEASSTFGTSVHAALQLYGEYLELSKSVKDGSDESALTSNPVLRPIVQKFFTEERKAEKAYYEEFVANEAELACGLIDRLVVEPDGLIVEDYKTNTSVADKKETILDPFKGVVPNTALGVYFLQLSYYSRALIAHGRNVKEVRIHHWTGDSWVTYSSPVIDLSKAFE